MKEEGWFGNSFVTRLCAVAAPSREAFVVFRGFPGEIPPGQEAKYAHLAGRAGIGQTLFDAAGRDVYLPAYEGLGANRRGRFTFENSVANGIAFAADLARRHERVHVVGYSWGGLVGYNAARGLGARRGKLILISPVADVIGSAVAELEGVRDRFNPATLARRDGAAGPALIVHGVRDKDVPIEPSRRLAALLKASFVELDDDHIFNAGWDRMLSEVAAFARGSTG